MIIEIKKPSKANRLTADYMTLWRQITWCARAVPEDAFRHELKYLVVQDGVVVATCGRRLHFTLKQESLKDGSYRVLKTGATILLDEVTDIGAYPSWKQAVPGEQTNEKKISLRNVESSMMRLVVAAHDVSDKGYFDMRYLEQSVPPGDYIKCTVRGTDSLSPLRIDYDDIGTALLMPMRML